MLPVSFESSLLSDLNKFNLDCGYDFTIIPIGNTAFYSDIKLLIFDDGTSFSIITDTVQEVILNNKLDCYSLFLTYSLCEYINGDRSYIVESGQLGFIDLSEGLYLKNTHLRIVKSLKIPKNLVNLEYLKLNEIMNSNFSSLIIYILSSITIDDPLILQKKDTIINLLTIF
ncbi:hypothetical protein C0W80_20635 [Photobacterium leiognathi subsp. mandapamensis]|uniref:hypothetical protein n=1 Tax=Photobacterium leiognathi TaxID=553611 RepID=UPI000D15136A|nr:hypothetical protein [Photobacterium leiognathi]PSU93297.1 hypothetical protein C0W80_20635 [Photobacterium leiognathi subsp. mandapamensis]